VEYKILMKAYDGFEIKLPLLIARYKRRKHGTDHQQMRRLPDAKKSRSEPESLYEQAVEMAHQLVPRLESLSKVTPGKIRTSPQRHGAHGVYFYVISVISVSL
jgi:hypothetical protein